VITGSGLILACLLLTACSSITGAIGKAQSVSDKLKAFTADDFEAAAETGIKARSAGQLPANDRWPECFQQIAARLRDVNSLKDDNDTTGIAQIAMRVHIIRVKGGEDGGISAECAQVVLRLEREGIKLGASLFPGGGLAGGILGKLPGF